MRALDADPSSISRNVPKTIRYFDEMASKALPPNPSAGDAHLISAAEALSTWVGSHRGEALGGQRVAALMTALAAEAYVNAALMGMASGSEFDGLDRLPTPDKFFIGLSYCEPALKVERGSTDANNLLSLFKVRNALTHSKVPEEAAMFPARTEVGKWIGSVARIVSSWNEVAPELIPKSFSRYSSHFADRSSELGHHDAEIQLNALADGLDASNPLGLLVKARDSGQGVTLAIQQTDLGLASRAVHWGTETVSQLNPETGEMEEGEPKRTAKP